MSLSVGVMQGQVQTQWSRMALGQQELLAQIGQRLRALRLERGRTQEEAAERAGYSGKYLSEIERGLRDVPLTTLHRIVEKGLGTTMGHVFSPVMPKPNPVEGRPPKKAQRLPADLQATLNAVMTLPTAARQRVMRILADVLRLAER